jgi:hypothetical protein
VSECGHDGWVFGCPICAREEAAALAAMGEPIDVADATWTPVVPTDMIVVPIADEEDDHDDD